MKYLLVLLVLTACTAPKTETKQKAVAEAPAQPAPPLDVDLSLEAFTNYEKYFEQSPRYPYIILEDGFIKGYGVPDYPIRFGNSGKTIIYTNKAGGLIINDEEVLLSYEEMEKVYYFRDPVLRRYHGDVIARQMSVYKGIDKYLTNEVTNIAQLSYYLKGFPKVENVPIDIIRFLLATYFQDLCDYREMIYSNISHPHEKAEFYSYFLGSQNIDLLIEKGDNVLDRLLVLDTMEKTKVRMLNLMLLSIMISQPDNNRYIFLPTMQYYDPYDQKHKSN